MADASDYEISTDPKRLDVGLIHSYLSGESYWARNISRERLERSIQHSICFAAYQGRQQVGFARVISDFATTAYIADVFVVSAHRGRGVSKLIMRAIMDHPDLQGLRRWLLFTKDAQELYRQFGFEQFANPEQFMTVINVNAYERT